MIVLSTVTLGIYAAFWWYFINRELRDLGRARNSTELGDSPTLSVLAVTLGALILVPPWVSTYNTCKRIQAAQRLSGERELLNGWIALVLFVLILISFIPFAFGYMQSELNKVWRNPELTDPLTPGLPHPGAQTPIPSTAAHATATAAQMPGAGSASPPSGQPVAPATEEATTSIAPATEQTSPAATPDWYPDPWSQARLRYWDGDSWTGHTAD